MATLQAVSSFLPAGRLTNAELVAENPSWNMGKVTERVGVVSRRVSGPGETAFDLSVGACEALIDDARSGIDLTTVDALLYCTQTPDNPLPGNGHLLHDRLGLRDDVMVLDYSLGCTGYLYGLAMADSFVASGLASRVLLVTAETPTKRIHPRDRSLRVLFGDGATASYVTAEPGDGRGEIVASRLCARGSGFERLCVPAGGARTPLSEETALEVVDASGNVRSAENLYMDGLGVYSFVSSTVPDHVRSFLSERSLTLDDIDLCVFHEASKLTADALRKALGIPADKLYASIAEVGNLSSSSVPCALSLALDEGAIQPGDRVLLCAFGVGLSYASVLLEF